MTPDEIEAAQEWEWQTRDDRVQAKLEKALADAAGEVQEARHLIEEKTEETRRVREAVREGRWYELGSYLTAKEIESLCEVSPVNLLGDYSPR